jgi:hypothetical protein
VTRRPQSLGLALALACLEAGCAPHVLRFANATRVEAYCGSKQARATGIASVLTSTDDRLLDDRPTEADARRAVSAGDGVLIYWHDQPLAMPRVSRELGEADGYVRVREAAIPAAPEGATTRHLYLLLRDRGGQRWVTVLAYDVQNVCVEGKREG